MNKLDLLSKEQDILTREFCFRRAKLLAQKHCVVKKTVAKCIHCEKRSQLKRWKIVLFGGASTAHSIRCPHCDEWNRFYGNKSLDWVMGRISVEGIDYKLVFIEVWYWAGGNMPMRRLYPSEG